jgi:hypothetical protein
LIVTAREIALVIHCAATGSRLIGRKSCDLGAIAAECLYDIGGTAAGHRSDQIQLAVSVDVTAGQRAQLVLPDGGKSRQDLSTCIQQKDAIACGHCNL